MGNNNEAEILLEKFVKDLGIDKEKKSYKLIRSTFYGAISSVMMAIEEQKLSGAENIGEYLVQLFCSVEHYYNEDTDLLKCFFCKKVMDVKVTKEQLIEMSKSKLGEKISNADFGIVCDSCHETLVKTGSFPSESFHYKEEKKKVVEEEKCFVCHGSGKVPVYSKEGK